MLAARNERCTQEVPDEAHRHVNTFRVSLILAIAVIATFALGAHQSVRSDQRRTERPDRHHKDKELWVTHQRDNTISVLSFPGANC